MAAALDLASSRSPKGTKYKHGALPQLSKKHNISVAALKRIGKQTRLQLEKNEGIDLSHQRSGREPPNLKLTPEVAEKVRQVNKETKGKASMRQLHAELQKAGVDVKSHTTVFSWTRELDAFKTRRSTIPILSRDHKVWRTNFCLDKTFWVAGHRRWEVKKHLDEVHVDEKWFALMPDGEMVRVIPNADGSVTLPAPARAQHKNAIPKTMFLAANARPRPEYGFDGKLGMWRVTELKEALRGSKNHERGDVYEVDVSITAEVYRNLLKTKVFPAIREKMWWKKLGNGHDAGPIYVQQDGATPHTAAANEAFFQQERRKRGFDIRVVTQPAQSPDLNFNDCSFFRSMHTRVRVKKHSNLDELGENILAAYREFPVTTLEHCWQVLSRNIQFIIKNLGDNNYKALRTKERTRRRQGEEENRVLTMAEVNTAKKFVDSDE
jgi:hypothetical protein